MKQISIVIGLLALLCSARVAFSTQDDIEQHRSCTVCGMDRKAYGFSRMLIRFEDGESAGVCSLHCAVIALNAQPSRKVASLLAADRDTREMIDAETAVWVLGGKKSGVMTRVPKWAFRSEIGAENFIRAYGGAMMPWAEVLMAAREELAGKPR